MDRPRLVFALEGDERYYKAHRTFGNDEMLTVPTDTIALNLERSSIDDNGLKDLTRLKSLRCLDLDSTGITDHALGAIAALPVLEELWLECTSVTDAGLINLHACQALRFVSVAHTGVSTAGIAALTVAVPGLTVAQ